jgi:predicted phage tail protein
MPLNSKTNLKLIDALCEGPIDGLVSGRNSVFLNETKVTREQQKVEEAVSFATRRGVRKQGSFDESSLLSDAQTTIIDVNEQIGKNYSETLNANNRVKERDYGEGQVVREITDTDADFVQLVFTVPKLYCVAPEGLARGQLFFARIKLELSIQDKDGSYNKVNIKAEGAIERNIIKGISTSSYQFKTQPINLKNKKGERKAPYRIRVKKLAFGNTDEQKERAFEIKFTDLEDLPQKTSLADKRADTIFWTSIIVGKRFKTNYPFTALVHLSIDSEEYNTLPARAYEVRGMKVKIPSNATPLADGSLYFGGLPTSDSDSTSTVPFDGSLKDGRFYTTCPVCCFYDLLTNKRYGCGDFIDESNVNWVDLIEIAKYCNETVSTPEGKEPRFAINTVLGSQAEAYNVLQDMASVFRGMLFWKADNVQIAADHGELGYQNVEAIHAFSNSNVVNGSFAYSGSSLKTRSTRVRVRYNDPENFYKPNFIIIEDKALIEKYGIQEKSVVAFGCTSKYQAQRMGRWIMESEKLHDETVSFSVGLEGLNVLPGQVFEVSDEMRSAVRLAGRIVGATKSFVDIDQTATLPSGSNNRLTVTMRDGTLETRGISSVSGSRIQLVSDFTQDPPDDALYAIRNDSNVLNKYRCLTVAEGEGGVYSVVGVKHVDGIYAIVEEETGDPALSDLFSWSADPSAPQNLQITFQQIADGRNTTNRATISWTRGLTGPVSEFRVRYKIGDGNWVGQFTENNSIDVNSNLAVGTRLYAEVQAIGPEPDRKRSAVTTADRVVPVAGTSDTVDGIAIVNLPPDPEGVTIEALGEDQVVLQWSSTASGQNLDSFVAVIRHSGKTNGTGTWPNSTLLRKVEARTTQAVLPLLNGEYLVKFENDQKQRSANAGSAVINIPEGIPRFNYEVVREDASPGEFPGDKVNVVYSDALDGLIFDGNASFDSIASLDGFTANLDTLLGTRFTNGEYFFQHVLDFGAKYSVRLQRILNARGIYLSDLIDDRTVLIDAWSDFDGIIPDDTNVEVYFRKSDGFATLSDIVNEDGDKIQHEDGGNLEQQSDLAFEEWIPLENNVYVGRSFQFKAVLSTEHVDQTPLVDQLGVRVQFERRTENSQTINSGTSPAGKTVTFADAFYTDTDTKVTVGITAFDLEPGDRYVISEPTATGFTITFRNTSNLSGDMDDNFADLSGGTVVARNFQYTAIGFGNQQS